MFTGLVTALGRVVECRRDGATARLRVDLGGLGQGAGEDPVRAGESICVSGTCLTVVGRAAGESAAAGLVADFDVSAETLARTPLGGLDAGARVNLERSLRVGDRLGGHFLTGHVDGVGEVTAVEAEGEYAVHEMRAPAEVWPLLVPKGSVGVDGVSLTVAELGEERRFRVALIPETRARTTLGEQRPGDRVALEGDLIGKYVLRHAALQQRDPEALRAALVSDQEL